MRLGKQPKKSRSWVQAGEYGKPQFISEETVIGQVSLDLISTVFAPKISDIADPMLEKYADDFLEYKEKLAEYVAGQASEFEVGADGSANEVDTGSMPLPPARPLFYSQATVEDFSETLADVTDYFFAPKGAGWKIHANAAKFERMLDEKYGVFKPFITNHPQLEKMVRSLQRKYAMGYFSPLRQNGPPIPRSTSVVILFLMKRGGIQWQIMTLAVLFFLVGLQPWALVAVVATLQTLLMRRKGKPIGTMKSRIPNVEPYYYEATGESPEESSKRKEKILHSKVGETLSQQENIDTSAYDTIVLGCGSPSLYTAALLSRSGRKVLVLSSRIDASGCLNLEHCQKNKKVAEKYKNIAFDVEASNIPKISRQQKLMAPALCTTTDFQGGIRFAQIGSKADGHAFEIISIPGVDGTDRDGVLFVVKADGGARAIMNDAIELGDGWPDVDGGIGSSTTGSFIAACESVNSSAGSFYLSKLLPNAINNYRKDSVYAESAIRYASSFLNKCFPTNTRTRSLMAAIGMKGENINPGAASMAAHVTNVCAATSGEGMHYPIGGPRALSRAFANVVERSGGRILTDVDVRDLLFDESETASIANDSTKPDEESQPAPRCVGVKLSDGREIRFGSERYKASPRDEPAVVSLLGFIDTFVRLLPEDVRTKYKVPRGLPALSERRPVFKVLFALRGSAEELSITGADYYRLPNASIALDEVDSTTGLTSHGEIGRPNRSKEGSATSDGASADDEPKDIIEDTNKDISDTETVRVGNLRRSKTSHQRAKFNTGVSWMQISFPSAKDPSFESRHGKVSTCVVTIEADDDFVTGFDTKPKLFVVNKETAGTAGVRQRLLDRVTRDLLETYPQLQERIEHSEVRGPYQRGLSHNPERYAAKGVRADDTPYPRLFVGGSDLTVGESFSGALFGGWLVANALMGYQVVDHLFLGKNISSDLEQFLEKPQRLPAASEEDEDLAVPLAAAFDETTNQEEVGTS